MFRTAWCNEVPYATVAGCTEFHNQASRECRERGKGGGRLEAVWCRVGCTGFALFIFSVQSEM
jgi:hypothetical protein